jgi:hypothetical protein
MTTPSRAPSPLSSPLIRPFPPQRDYASLSIKDLLDAREAYHVYLSTLENVVATAIGRYLIHQDDWYATNPPDRPRPPDYPKAKLPRTLENSVVRPWSWPCVLVFVREKTSEDMGVSEVPRSLYLPDGRVVPTCVVMATPDESLPPSVPGPSQVSGLIGGGYLVARAHQGTVHNGTIACIVTRDGSYYALTNRHVTGLGADVIKVYVRGRRHRIGQCSDIGLTELKFNDAFPAWPGDRTYVTLDAGLMRIDDITDWTSQAFGIGEIGVPFDATEQSVTLDVIGVPVRAFGGVSGVIEGEIRALFFRYESLGGIDRVTDVLIGPKTEKKRQRAPEQAPFTRPGDSGTLWFYDPPTSGDVNPDVGGQLPPARGARARRLRPIAMQWGGERFISDDGTSSAFALGTFISTIFRELDVEPLRDWSTGHDEYWGKIGHFAVGWKACDRVTGKLGTLMKANQPFVGFGNDDLKKGSEFRMGTGKFVPLADVPDYVWVNSRHDEPVQHFADIDIHDIDGGASLLERGHKNPKSVAASVWKKYFDGFKAAKVGPEEGTLPFRVWQLWEDMVDYLNHGDVIHFVAAAGVLAHYVGDASQPLHCSYLHHGIPPMLTHQGRKYPVPKSSAAFKAFKKTRPAKIHGIYEETMLEVGAVDALPAIDAAVAKLPSKPNKIKSGHDAAVETVRLMYAAQQRLTPRTIINADDPALSDNGRAARLWAKKKIREATIASLADSVRLLADLWTSAWVQGNGDVKAANQLVAFSEPQFDAICRQEADFAPSIPLDDMAKSKRFEPK